MSLTRRTFASLFAAGSSALASTTGFVEHKLLRRPYVWKSSLIARPGYQWRGLRITLTHNAPVRITVGCPGMEPLTQVTVGSGMSLGPYSIQSVVGLDAALGMTIQIDSKTPFTFVGADLHFMISSARIKEWVAANGQSLGGTSDMGDTWLIERIGP